MAASHRLTRGNPWTGGQKSGWEAHPGVLAAPFSGRQPARRQPRSPRPDMRGNAMGFTAAEQAAMLRALALAATPGVPLGPNPRVGCVLVDDTGTTVAEGFHRGAGSLHAEADALAQAGE